METSIIVGWSFLISSLVIPYFIRDASKKRIAGITLSAIALGIFIGQLCNLIFLT